ncbi:AraC family transcriptional regulator [Actinomycetospora chibensis]|uniref:AraC family transcriptional regulator n=1 Tax=Actinomycetospora chibensis TaxID=663606 RepID=A0ABV9RPY9_9PSEU|nr:AraC family transcriptional regulator [Actinomycetospora chibensis]MDD7927390.1 AraC family transcriptional regulator [Actinomycetospora chibensis]
MTVAAHPPWTPSDAVGAALHVLRMSGTFYCSSDLRGPWGLRLPETPGCLWFHVVTSGTATIVVGDEVVTLSPSDVVLLPRGEGHEMRSTDPPPRSPASNVLTLPHTWYGERYATITYGGDGAPTTMICGAVRLEHPMAERLVALMPDVVHVPVSPLTARLHDTLRLIALEVEETRPGGEAVITRLADVLVVQMLRAWLSDDPSARTGWLGALADPDIGRALALVHADPAHEWTVAGLARELALSRSTFAARFTALVGEPVMAYVTRWRMLVAHDRLRAGDTTVAAVAGAMGYRSEAAFSRAFRRVVGTSPGSVRPRARDEVELLGA